MWKKSNRFFNYKKDLPNLGKITEKRKKLAMIAYCDDGNLFVELLNRLNHYFQIEEASSWIN